MTMARFKLSDEVIILGHALGLNAESLQQAADASAVYTHGIANRRTDSLIFWVDTRGVVRSVHRQEFKSGRFKTTCCDCLGDGGFCLTCESVGYHERNMTIELINGQPVEEK